MLKLKRVYEARQDSDGVRILVDRLWPRGLSSAGASIDEWMKEIAPSNELRRWFGHEAGKWAEFRGRYLKELASEDRAPLERVGRLAAAGDVTLLYAAKDTEHNNAVVLAEAITAIMKRLS